MQYLTRDIASILCSRAGRSLSYKKGDVGIEIEVEGRNLPRGIGPWVAKQDGSLRGEAVEYVLRDPVLFKNVKSALELLSDWFNHDAGTKLNMSHRTSVHVHLNCQRFFTQEIYNLICLYFLFEEFLISFCGTERNGNVYCLCATDAEYFPLKVIDGLNSGLYLDNVANDDIRYSALNLKAIHDFGSVEFRSFRGTTSPNEISEWVTILEHLYRASLEFASPEEIIEGFNNDQEAFIARVFKGSGFDKFIFGFPKWKQKFSKGFAYAFEMAHTHRGGWVNLKDVRKHRLENPDKPLVEEVPKKKTLEEVAQELMNQAPQIGIIPQPMQWHRFDPGELVMAPPMPNPRPLRARVAAPQPFIPIDEDVFFGDDEEHA